LTVRKRLITIAVVSTFDVKQGLQVNLPLVQRNRIRSFYPIGDWDNFATLNFVELDDISATP
jgi:hypothetical protein